MKLISIDTGKNGAAVLWDNREVIGVYIFKPWQDGIDSRDFNEWMKVNCCAKTTVAIERVPTLPNQSVKTTAKQFNAVGATYAICMLHTDTLIDFYPSQWVTLTRRLSRDSQSYDKKAKVLTQGVVKEYFEEIFDKYRKRTKAHDGVVDAICIGMYAQIDHFSKYVIEGC